MNPVRLGKLLDGETKKLGLASKLRLGLAMELWPRVVGSEIARQTEAGPVRDRLLFVRTPNPVLAHQLGLMEREILQRYRKLIGGCLRGLRVQIGQIQGTAQDTGEGAPAVEALSEAQEKELADLAGTIPDPELAAAFLRAVRAWALRHGPSEETPMQAYLALMTDDTWPTAAEARAALAAVEPARREEAKKTAVERLRGKIAGRLRQRPLAPDDSLGLRGDLRRLAMVLGHSLAGAPRQDLPALFGLEPER